MKRILIGEGTHAIRVMRTAPTPCEELRVVRKAGWGGSVLSHLVPRKHKNIDIIILNDHRLSVIVANDFVFVVVAVAVVIIIVALVPPTSPTHRNLLGLWLRSSEVIVHIKLQLHMFEGVTFP